jgi:cytochrome c peroxidase
MGEPQFGPGKAARFESHARDEGRFRVTNDPADMFAFRTPSLRNVTLTAPYGHTGSHGDLAAFIAAHANPATVVAGYDRADAVLPDLGTNDWRIMDDATEVASIAAAASSPAVALSAEDLALIVAFLGSLTDPVAKAGRLGVPDSVPSGLTVPNP